MDTPNTTSEQRKIFCSRGCGKSIPAPAKATEATTYTCSDCLPKVKGSKALRFDRREREESLPGIRKSYSLPVEHAAGKLRTIETPYAKNQKSDLERRADRILAPHYTEQERRIKEADHRNLPEYIEALASGARQADDDTREALLKLLNFDVMMKKLTDQELAVLTRRIEGKSFREVAGELNIPKSTVEAIAERACKKLREVVQRLSELPWEIVEALGLEDLEEPPEYEKQAHADEVSGIESDTFDD